MRIIVLRDERSYPNSRTGYANPHAVTSVGGASYTYDNNGNVTAIGSLDYTWDWRNRLASADRSSGGTTSYGYDHTGQRVFQASGSATTSYPNRYYNVASSSLAATTTKHIFSPDGTLLATVVGSGTANASTTYLHPDHLAGTNVTTDEDGEVTQTLDYYPYGSQRIATGSFSEQRRFIGEEYDGDTEPSYLNARYYQGSRGQFMSQDSVFLLIGDRNAIKRLHQQDMMAALADPQSLNAYAYANLPLAISGDFVKFLVSFAVLVIPLALLWSGFAWGTYITVEDDDKLYGTLFFIRGNTNLLSDIISIRQRYIFGGVMTQAVLEFRKKDGTIGKRSLASGQSLKKGEYKKLVEAIRAGNPKIKIDKNLIGEMRSVAIEFA